MIPALLVATKRRVLCLLGRHDWAELKLRPATYWFRVRGYWFDSEAMMGGFLGTRVCRVAACCRVELEVAQNWWVGIERTVPRDSGDR